MKKLLLISSFCFFAVIVFAQKNVPADYTLNAVSTLTPLTVAPDFSITFTNGTPANLYTTLNGGNTVLLDFFYTTCGYCQAYAPTIEQSYTAHGSGSGNIKFWGIDQGDNNSQVDAYKTQYGVSNPCASGTQGNGNAVVTLYSSNFNFTGFPTYTVICPDKTVHWDVNYPPTATGFNTYFTQCGTTSLNENNNPSVTMFTLSYPSPANTMVTFNVFVDASSSIAIEIADITGKIVYSNVQDVNQGYFKSEIDLNALTNGTYFVRLLQDGNLKDTEKFLVIK